MSHHTALLMLKAPLRKIWRPLKRVLNRLNRRPLHNRDWLAHLHALNRGSPVRVAYDVGANRGQTLVEFLQLMPEAVIHAFEPIPEVAGELRKRLGGESRVRHYNLALDETEGERVFRVNAYSQTSSFLEGARATADLEYMALQRSITVQTTTVDRHRALHGIAELDVLKLDVQGSEAAVLRGAASSLPTTKAVYAEVSFGRFYEGQTEFAELDVYMRQQGFWLFSLYHLSHASDGRLMSGDALWLNGRYYGEDSRPVEAWEHRLSKACRRAPEHIAQKGSS